jgi:CheY-like chemotaxis protein
VAIARDGASALSRVKQERPEIIVLDSELPKLDGAEVCRQLKTTAVTADIPVVMMTHHYIDIYDVGAEGGPDAFVVRPFVPAALANVVEHALSAPRK